MAARRVCCRSGRSCASQCRRERRCSRRSSSIWGERSWVRAAASSMASGRPSRCTTSSANARAFSSLGRKPLKEWRRARIKHAQALCNRGGHLRRVANGGEIDKPDPVREEGAEALSGLEGQTGLADTGRTGQGEQPGRAPDEKLANQLKLLRASQEGGRVGPAAGNKDGGRRCGLRHG